MYLLWHEFIDFLCIVSSFIYAHLAAQRHDGSAAIIISLESIFLTDCLLTFIKTFDDPADKMRAVRKLSDIFANYTQGKFIYDFIALILFNWLSMYRDRQFLFYIFKVIRLKRGIENLDVMDYLDCYKNRVQRSIEKKIKKMEAKKKAKDCKKDKMMNEQETELLTED